MLTLQGVGTSFGVGDGPLHRYIAPGQIPCPDTISNPEEECRQLDAAMSAAGAELRKLRDNAVADGLPVEDASLLDMQYMMLEDEDFLAAVHCAVLEHHLCAEYAIHSTGRAFAAQLRTLGDPYLCERSEDVMDVSQRVLRILGGEEQANMLKDVTGRIILATDTLLPSQAMQLDRTKVAAFVLRDGAQNSHTAILARSLGIPTVTGLGNEFDKLRPGLRTMVDGESGLVTQEPDTPMMSQLAQKMLQSVREERQLQMLKGVPAKAADGTTIALTANIYLPADAKKAISYDAEGIGLFRSELLYLKDGAFPDEESLYQAYREVLLMMGGKRVVVRLLDYSSDKQAFCLNAPAENNPALGFRSIPYGLSHPALFEPQLRALLRASAYGNLAILLPLIVCADEVHAVKERLGVLRHELRREHKLVSDRIAVGALIETPGAAMTADLIATEADFLSIGTNDLAQYLLLADRRIRHDADMQTDTHPAVLRTVAQIVRAAHAADIPVSICGESAGDTALAGFFAGLRVTELSMVPSSILRMKRAIRALTADDCRAAMRKYLHVPHTSHLPSASSAEQTDTPEASQA